jgi:uncharacterized protein YPO0396
MVTPNPRSDPVLSIRTRSGVMRRLEAARLVQWYHFQDELLPIGASCLLLGDNGSGKTTVLDAIHVGLVADLSEVLLNRAANEKSRRALYGYVRSKIGAEDESRQGAVHFGRGACTPRCCSNSWTMKISNAILARL